MLGTLTPQAFIAQYWQQQPLLLRGACPDAGNLVDGDDLAGIACEADGDARLVVADGGDWRAEHGPFDERFFAQLPPRGWTLLVQAVDQWIPDVAALLPQFAFLPRWRLDDIMVSYATDGGGVGPHFDYYDVFLLQASGRREWKLGQHCDAHSPLRDNPYMKLLRDFDTQQTQVLQAGDVLYLPAGVAHWGTALGDDCITVSIGFRAPSCAELLEAALADAPDHLPEHQRYRDTAASIDADPWRINEAAVDNLEALCRPQAPAVTRDALLQALGRLATEPRYPQHIAAEDGITVGGLDALLARGPVLALEHHPASRLAYYAAGDDALLFVDGEAWQCPTALAQGLCHGRVTPALLPGPDERALLLALLNQGSLWPAG